MRINQKGFAPIFLIIGILVLIVVLLVPIPSYQKYELPCAPCPPTGPCPVCPAVGWHFGPSLWQKISNKTTVYPTTQVEQVPATTPSDETANWKTYTNAKYNFSFKYPDQIFAYSQALAGDVNTDLVFYKTEDIAFSNISLRMKVIEDLSGNALGVILNDMEKHANYNKPSRQAVKIGGEDGYKELIDSWPANIGTDTAASYSGYVLKNGNLISITLESGNPVILKQNEKLFDQVLSTFTFLDQKDKTDINIFTLANLKVGDKIAGMVIKEIAPFNPKYSSLSATNFKILFSGEVTLSGKYSISDGTSGVGLKEVSFCLDDKSENLLPKESSNTLADCFAFNDYDNASKLLEPKGVTGNAKVIIGNYMLISYPSEVSSAADLIKVVQD